MDDAEIMINILDILNQLGISISYVTEEQYNSIKKIVENIWWDGYHNCEYDDD